MFDITPDIRTIMMMDVLIAALNSVVMAIVWRTYRNLPGVAEMAAGTICLALAEIPTPVGTGPVACALILLSDLTSSLALGLTAKGLAGFLGQRHCRFLPHILCVYTFLSIGAALLYAPEDRALRTVATFPTVAASLCCSIVTLWRDRILSRSLRFPPIAISLAWLVFSAVLAVLAAIYGVRPKAENSQWEAVYWIAGGLIPDGQFLCLLGVIAVRLNADLRTRNGELSVEIEHRRRLERQLSAALATERQARSDQRHLLEIVGHEIRTPLAGIDRSAEMMELMPPSVETMTRRVAGIRGAVRRMIELIDQLLLAERAVPLIQRAEPLVLGALIGQIRSELDAAAAARLRIAGAAESARFTADQTAMLAVLRNLVENALKYSPDDSPVMVETAESEDELRISIIDRGIGIPAEDRTAIGHRFFRAGNVGTIPGTGLGLFAVRRFLADQGGRLSIEPAPGGIGTAMVVTLPMPEPAHEPAVLRYA